MDLFYNRGIPGIQPDGQLKAYANGGQMISITASSAMTSLIDAVEWSDTLAPGSWSSAGVTEQILTDNGTVQQVKASVAAGSNERRFIRLRVQ